MHGPEGGFPTVHEACSCHNGRPRGALNIRRLSTLLCSIPKRQLWIKGPLCAQQKGLDKRPPRRPLTIDKKHGLPS